MLKPKRTTELIAAMRVWATRRGVHRGLKALLGESADKFEQHVQTLEQVRKNPAVRVIPSTPFLEGMKTEARNLADQAAKVHCNITEIKGQFVCIECGVERDAWENGECGLSPKYKGEK